MCIRDSVEPDAQPVPAHARAREHAHAPTHAARSKIPTGPIVKLPTLACQHARWRDAGSPCAHCHATTGHVQQSHHPRV
eukprot:2422157-Alexandrium_andersonii.AAC.1